MAEQLKPIDILNCPEGNMVMGRTEEGFVFEGKVGNIIDYDIDKLPKSVMVIGTLYNGESNVPFSRVITCDKLKIFDEDIIDIAIEMIVKYVAFIESADNCKLECERLLS